MILNTLATLNVYHFITFSNWSTKHPKIKKDVVRGFLVMYIKIPVRILHTIWVHNKLPWGDHKFFHSYRVMVYTESLLKGDKLKHKSTDTRARISVQPGTHYVTNHFKPKIPYQYSGGNNSSYSTKLLGKLNELINAKCLRQCLAV